MISQPEFLYFLIASLVLIIVPGPDIIFLVTQSVHYGSRAGLLTAIGLASGNLVHTSIVAIGITVITQLSKLTIISLKFLGAAYLLYLAYRAIATNNAADMAATKPRLYNSAFFKHGLILNVLNPKIAMFFMAFLPQFIPDNSAHPQLDVFMLGGIFALMVTIIFGCIGMFSGKLLEKSRLSPLHRSIFNWVIAIIFTLLAINLLLFDDL